jgi:hypothetical protein
MIAQSVAEIINRHVKLTVEGIDRMYLNIYVPGLYSTNRGLSGSSASIVVSRCRRPPS